ncbi:MAG TPA: MBL fold metallo-hydrolase, partial [Acidimicrobiales bacterium]|nr:MBL fold metallo-hydrolase [Acidimicrobiales bacterium]
MSAASDRDDWTEPGLFEVAPGVYRIPLPLPNDGLRAVNAYALVDDEGLDLVDPGWALPESRARLADALERIDRTLGHVGRFLVTHLHRDHYTQAVALRRDFGTPVGIGRGEHESLD